MHNHPQEFETNGSHNLDKNRTSGSLKAKLKFPDHGEHLIELSQIDISSLYAYTVWNYSGMWLVSR